jgi:AcrR family transcriptional regulator
MNSSTRTYNMDARRAAAEGTRERILGAAREAFLEAWYDEVTIQSIAKEAGVSGQTVLNHFGDKEGVFAAAAERFNTEVRTVRWSATPGDVDSVTTALVDDYEVTGDGVFRALASEERVPALRPLLARGRAGHRQWVEDMFDRPDLVLELIAATDVYAWKLLRRDQGLSGEATRDHICRTVKALLALEPQAEESNR